MKDQIKIIVAGPAGVGKSTIIQLLTAALAKRKIKFEISEETDPMPRVKLGTYSQNRRVAAVRKKAPRIVIGELTLYNNTIDMEKP